MFCYSDKLIFTETLKGIDKKYQLHICVTTILADSVNADRHAFVYVKRMISSVVTLVWRKHLNLNGNFKRLLIYNRSDLLSHVNFHSKVYNAACMRFESFVNDSLSFIFQHVLLNIDPHNYIYRSHVDHEQMLPDLLMALFFISCLEESSGSWTSGSVRLASKAAFTAKNSVLHNPTYIVHVVMHTIGSESGVRFPSV